MIDFNCSSCGEHMSVPSCLVGQTDTCPECGANVPVPDVGDQTPDVRQSCSDGTSGAATRRSMADAAPKSIELDCGSGVGMKRIREVDAPGRPAAGNGSPIDAEIMAVIATFDENRFRTQAEEKGISSRQVELALKDMVDFDFLPSGTVEDAWESFDGRSQLTCRHMFDKVTDFTDFCVMMRLNVGACNSVYYAPSWLAMGGKADGTKGASVPGEEAVEADDPDELTKLTEAEALGLLEKLCNAYMVNDTEEIKRLEPIARQIGEALHEMGGRNEMRRVFDLLGPIPGQRTLEMHWGGIGNW